MKIKRKNKYVIIILVSIALMSIGSTTDKAMNVDIDFAQFRHKEDRNYLEVYYSFTESSLTYVKDVEGFRGSLLINIMVHSLKNDSLVFVNTWSNPHTVEDTHLVDPNRRIVGVLGIEILSEPQTLTVRVVDEQSPSNSDSLVYSIPPKSFPGEQVATSDIELCSAIKKIDYDPDNRLYKNTYEVTPNPSGQFSTTQPYLYYYLETYNLVADGETRIYKTKAAIYNANDDEVLIRERQKTHTQESSVEVGFFNLNELPKGNYNLVYSLSDSITGATTQLTKSFQFVVQPKVSGRLVIDYEQILPEYQELTEEKLDQEFAQLQYIATKNEQSAYQGLPSLASKRSFLTEFWNRRNTPALSSSAYKKEYLSRVKYTNIHFSYLGKQGWESDRGRILILYGYPDEIEYFSTEINAKPYQIWYYYQLQGGVVFVFADLSGFQNYLLLHSTHRNELRNENWMNQVVD